MKLAQFSILLGAALATLACAGLLSRPTLDVTTDLSACGTWSLDVRASAQGESLAVMVNGTDLHKDPIHGQATRHFEGQAEPGSELTYLVEFADQSAGATQFMPAHANRVDLTLAPGPYPENRLPDVVFTGTLPCPAVQPLTWSAVLYDGSTARPILLEQPLTPGQPTHVELGHLPRGTWELELTLSDAGGTVQARKRLPFPIIQACLDRDGDGVASCEGDCDDQQADVHPGAAELTGNGRDDDCDGVDPDDLDQDGYAGIHAGGADCNDASAQVHPGRPEEPTANQVDDNCDGRVDEGTTAYDDDNDGMSEEQGDCNDGDKTVYPGALEVHDCKDQDCDGVADEGVQAITQDDNYESNATRDTAYNLGKRSRREFSETLMMVTSSPDDEEWFRFYSQDGDWDDWGIDVRFESMPDGSTYRVELFDDSGNQVAGGDLSATDREVRVRGTWLQDDSGVYWLRIAPSHVPGSYCPATVSLVSR